MTSNWVSGQMPSQEMALTLQERIKEIYPCSTKTNLEGVGRLIWVADPTKSLCLNRIKYALKSPKGKEGDIQGRLETYTAAYYVFYGVVPQVLRKNVPDQCSVSQSFVDNLVENLEAVSVDPIFACMSSEQGAEDTATSGKAQKRKEPMSAEHLLSYSNKKSRSIHVASDASDDESADLSTPTKPDKKRSRLGSDVPSSFMTPTKSSRVRSEEGQGHKSYTPFQSLRPDSTKKTPINDDLSEGPSIRMFMSGKHSTSAKMSQQPISSTLAGRSTPPSNTTHDWKVGDFGPSPLLSDGKKGKKAKAVTPKETQSTPTKKTQSTPTKKTDAKTPKNAQDASHYGDPSQTEDHGGQFNGANPGQPIDNSFDRLMAQRLEAETATTQMLELQRNAIINDRRLTAALKSQVQELKQLEHDQIEEMTQLSQDINNLRKAQHDAKVQLDESKKHLDERKKAQRDAKVQRDESMKQLQESKKHLDERTKMMDALTTNGNELHAKYTVLCQEFKALKDQCVCGASGKPKHLSHGEDEAPDVVSEDEEDAGGLGKKSDISDDIDGNDGGDDSEAAPQSNKGQSPGGDADVRASVEDDQEQPTFKALKSTNHNQGAEISSDSE